jgi:hypothetical protein
MGSAHNYSQLEVIGYWFSAINDLLLINVSEFL